MKQEKESNGMGVASLVVSITSLLCIFMPYFGLPLAILALVFASKQKKINETGLATAGNVIGIISIVINSVMLVFVVLVLLFATALGV